MSSVEKKIYLIIPSCSDSNRGDQALVWETREIAEKCGYKGDYYLISERNEMIDQTKAEGISVLTPILEHPSRIFKSKRNTLYTFALKIRWGSVAILDFIYSILILFTITRRFTRLFLNDEKRRTLQVFYKADAVFIKGGGLFQTYGGISATYSMYYWCYHIFLASALKKKIYMMPNSLGPFEGPLVKSIITRALRCCQVVSTRETVSKDVVREQLGLDTYVFPDLAFALDKSLLDKELILSKYNIPENRRLIAITMRPFRFPKSDKPEMAYEKYKCEMRAFILWLYDHGLMGVIVEQTIAYNSHENDSDCINEVLNGIDKNKYAYISDQSFNCRDLKALYGMFDCIVGTRFHSVIFSFGNNVPGIAISYSGNKALGIMKDVGLEDYVVSIYDLNAKILEEKLESLFDNKDEIIDKIEKYNLEVEKRLHCLCDLCRKVDDETGFCA